MRKAFLAAAVSSVAFISAGAGAQESPAAAPAGKSCMQWPAAMTAAQTSSPDAALVKVMEGNLASQFIQIVNEVPPVSDVAGDHVALFYRPQSGQFMIVVGQESCATHVLELPASVFERMVGRPA
jgi:hypothetical protein